MKLGQLAEYKTKKKIFLKNYTQNVVKLVPDTFIKNKNDQ